MRVLGKRHVFAGLISSPVGENVDHDADSEGPEEGLKDHAEGEHHLHYHNEDCLDQLWQLGQVVHCRHVPGLAEEEAG